MPYAPAAARMPATKTAPRSTSRHQSASTTAVVRPPIAATSLALTITAL